MRSMFDSTTAEDIPADAVLVGGYVDGSYAWSDADWARFPNAVKVRIAVFATTNDGDVLDCENGDATPGLCPGWIRMRQAAGLARPTIYCNRSTRPQVEVACSGLAYDLWISTLDGVEAMDPGAVATQWQGQAQSGQHYDQSLVLDTWMPAPSPVPDTEVEPMRVIIQPNTCEWVPGPGPGFLEYFNLVAEFATTVEVMAYGLDGTVLGAKTFTLAPNEPNVKGPAQAYGSLADLGDPTDASVTYGLWNRGTNPAVAVLH